MSPHAGVHRRRDEHGPAVSERRLGRQVVRQPVSELGERVRRAGSDDEQVAARQVRVQIVAGGPPGEREKSLGPNEPLGAGRDERHDVVPALDEQPRQLAGLVRRDSTADTPSKIRATP